MALTIAHLERHLAEIAANPQAGNGYGYAYVETGRYKPYGSATVLAAKRRGYRVEKAAQGVFYVYPKTNQGA